VSAGKLDHLGSYTSIPSVCHSVDPQPKLYSKEFTMLRCRQGRLIVQLRGLLWSINGNPHNAQSEIGDRTISHEQT